MSDNQNTTKSNTILNPSVRSGPEVIASYLKTLSTQPGVYRMLDAEGIVIYVGKARNLKARVSSYISAGTHSNRILRMIQQTASMEFVSVRTEAEALLLEANLIKRFKPRFNVLLRDDKSYPYILIRRDTIAPQILKHRGARTIKGDYFGPFASAGAVNRAIGMLQRAFLLRSCSDAVFEGRTRPCLLFQIKRCAGPCTNEISDGDYKTLVEEAVRFLKGESQNVRQMYQGLMQEASDNLDFEKAATYRNRLWALAHVQADQSINTENIQEADVFAAHQDGGQTCIEVFFFRAGQNWGNRTYFPKADKTISLEEILGSFIAQFYDDKPIPKLLLLSHDFEDRALLEEALSQKAERKVEIRVPIRGIKSGLVEHALSNAKEALGRKLAEASSQALLLEGLSQRFGLPHIPRRIEVYDNSHISGTNALGVMIVVGQEGFEKSAYRKFNIKSADLAPGDDYAMMREVLTRRFKRLSKTSQESEKGLSKTDDTDTGFVEFPDLLLIDGGSGQVSIAKSVLEELKMENISIVGVAKGPDRDAGREHFFFPMKTEPLMLEPRDPVLYFVQRLRDEAHRFAIGAHRNKRSKSMRFNALDEIEGIGPTRRRALLLHFGSAKSVSKASIEDLKTVEGISAEIAQKVYNFFHE
ncbi:MAG: excinuclease ABC subunit UvrC [Hyphomicrobium sp.]